jgi:hypothetical protein
VVLHHIINIIIFKLFIKIKFSIHFSPFIITYSYFLFSFIVLQFSRSNPVPLEFFFSFSSFILWFNRLLALTSSSLYFLTDRFATKYVPIPTTKQTDLKWKYIYLKYNVIKKILENIKLDGAKISLFDSDFSPDYSSLSIVKYTQCALWNSCLTCGVRWFLILYNRDAANRRHCRT